MLALKIIVAVVVVLLVLARFFVFESCVETRCASSLDP